MKKVIIIGGSSGMGLATAILLQKEGFEIEIVGRSAEKLTQAAQTIGQAEKRVLDVTQEAEVEAFFASHPPFDHLVLSAADFVMGPFLELPVSEARRFFDSKFWGQYSAARAAAPKIRPSGSITFFSGIAGQKPAPNLAVASAINSAIEGLTRALALELKPIRVNAISPGTIATPVWKEMPEKQRQSFFEHLGKILPAGRVGRPEEIAQVVKCLVTCEYLTGEVITCDGGARLI